MRIIDAILAMFSRDEIDEPRSPNFFDQQLQATLNDQPPPRRGRPVRISDYSHLGAQPSIGSVPNAGIGTIHGIAAISFNTPDRASRRKQRQTRR
jgi:hypothetical protein